MLHFVSETSMENGRSFKGFLGLETGIPKYEIVPSGEKVTVSPEVA